MSRPDTLVSPVLAAPHGDAPVCREARPRGVAAAWLRRVALPVVAGALMLMAVTCAIGRPTVFTDTDDYFSQGKDVVRALQVWATKGTPPINPADVDDRLHDPGDQDEEPVHNQNGARSVYYGLFVYACERLGTLWLLAAAQAVLAATVVYALWRAVAPGARTQSYLLTMAALAVGSSLPVFTGFAMPDLFAGFAVVATLLTTLYADRFGAWGKAGLWLLLAACMNFHGSNLLTSLGLSVLALGWLAWRRAPRRRLAGRAGMVASAAVVAVLAAQAYVVAIKLRTGDDLGRPPFLTARVLADGPGRDYLRHACSQGVRWTLCAYRRDPLDSTEDILWSDDPATGIFNSAEYHTRVKLEREEHAFVLHALAYEPLREAGAALANWGRQLVSIGYEEPLRDPAYYLADDYWKTTTLRPLLLRERRCDPEVGGCILNLPAVLMSEVDAALAVAALGWLGWMLWADWRGTRRPSPSPLGGGSRWGISAGSGSRAPPPPHSPPSPEGESGEGGWRDPARLTRAAVVLMALAVALNAAVCGILSGPFDRYEARLLWLIPAAALLFRAAVRPRLSSTTAPAGSLP